MEILFVLLILLVITRTFGEVVARFGQPPLVGELLSGISLGIVIQLLPDLFPIMKNINQNEVFKAITDLGIFFLMLLAGLEMQPRELAQSSKRSLIVALGGMMLPLIAGVGLGWIFLPRSQFFLAQVLFIGTALAITAVPVAVKVLMDLNKLGSQSGRIVVSSAIIDDILSLLLLAVLIALIRTGTFPSMIDLLTLSGQVVLFFAITIGIGLLLLPRLEKLVKISVTEEFEFSSLLMVALAFAVFAETLQMHFILGAFIAGLFFTKRTLDPQIFEGVKNRVSGITTGFLAPVFFASIGMRLDLSALEAIPVFLLLLIVAAVLGKLLGAGVPVFWMTRNWKEALVVGSSMNARGAVGLIIADIALRQGLFSHPDPAPAIVSSLFSAIVIMAVITTLLTPVALRWVIFHLHSKK
jgi:Kef-type K+ transport system membrane component KefB